MARVTHVEAVHGADAKPYLPQLASLRITVFREFPYLYIGDPDYEEWYLQSFARSDDTVIVLAYDGEDIVGASTGMPLEDEDPEFAKPFVDKGIDPPSVFYFGESVILPAYRGQGTGHKFFDLRERHARELERPFDWLALAAVVRDNDDPRKPDAYRPLDGFWQRKGFHKREDLVAHFAWQEIDEPAPSEKPLVFWLKPFKPAHSSGGEP